ncbi:MAG: sodium:proton exchanger [Actinobacteria bacterium]|nr:sodium:proton exchanger [Actinomycetota bacterium]
MAALLIGYGTQRAGLSPIVGYLLAGVLVGPHTPGFQADHSLAEQLAEIGVILLMFGVGLHFHFRELYQVRHVAIPGAVLQSGVATLLGLVAARLLGWSWSTGLIYGGAISVASTVVLIRVLTDNRDLHTRAGHIAVGWLVVEDLLTVVALVLLPAIVGGDLSPTGLAAATGMVVLKIGTLVAALLIGYGTQRAGLSPIVGYLLAGVLVGPHTGAAKGFGVSMALGAFLAGMIVGRSDFSLRAASEALPMRDAFAVLFFVSIGMLLDPVALLRSPMAILVTLAIVLVAKPAAALVVLFALRYPPRVALPVAVALAQIGEFSFILAALGRQLGVMPDEAVNTLVAASIVSITLNPLLYRSTDALERWLGRFAAGADGAADDGSEDVDDAATSQKAIVVGYGPVGRTVAQLLLDNGIEPTVIELNLDTVRRLRTFDVRAVYGDASRPEILAEAGILRATSLILTSATGGLDAEIIRRAKEMNPGVLVLARAQYVPEVEKLRRAGADDAFSAEGEVALAFTARLLERLGATGEQIDRERRRVEETFRHG